MALTVISIGFFPFLAVVLILLIPGFEPVVKVLELTELLLAILYG